MLKINHFYSLYFFYNTIQLFNNHIKKYHKVKLN